MKFTEEQAREALRAELTNKGRKSLAMSDRTLAKTTESLIKRLADEEMGLPDFVEIAVEILNPVNDNIRKDKSDFANKWKEEHPEKDPDKEKETSEEKKEDEKNPELKALLERIAVLERKNAENAKQTTIAQKRKDVVAKLKEKGVDDDEWMNSLLSEVNITEDIDVDAKAESWLKLYNKSQAGNGIDPVAPKNPNGGSKDSRYAEAIKNAASLAKRDRATVETK